MTKSEILKATRAARVDSLTRAGTTEAALRKFKNLTLTKKELIEIGVGDLVATALNELSPKKMISGDRNLLIFGPLMVDPTFPAATGNAGYSSAFPSATPSGVQIAFPQLKKGKLHLVEFHVQLNMSQNYKFRVFQFPRGTFADLTIAGPASTIIPTLVDPFPGLDLELGALLQNRNTVAESAGWNLHKVRYSALT